MKYLKPYYITEGHIEEFDSLDDAVDWIKKYSVYNEDILPLYRTDLFEDKREYFILDPLKYDKERYSPHGNSNFHNLLISNLPSWKKFPRRNKSIIFGNKSRGARHFANQGNKYRLFPLKNAEIGVIEGDFWKIKDQTGEHLPNIAAHVVKFLERKYTGRLRTFISDTDWDAVYKLMIDIENNENILDIKKELMEFGSDYYKFNKNNDYTILEIVDNIFKSDKVKLVKYNNEFTVKYFQKKIFSRLFGSDTIEFWTESPCLLIDMEYDDELKFKLN